MSAVNGNREALVPENDIIEASANNQIVSTSTAPLLAWTLPLDWINEFKGVNKCTGSLVPHNYMCGTLQSQHQVMIFTV